MEQSGVKVIQAPVAPTSDMASMERELAELRRKLAQYEPDNVIETTFAPGEVPRYRLNTPCYIDNTYFDANSEIVFTGVPNLEMVPVNGAAEARMKEHIEYLTECQREYCEANGRAFNGLMTDKGVQIAIVDQDVRKRLSAAPPVVMPVANGEPPPMAHMAPKRGPGRPRKTVLEATPPPQPERKTPEQGFHGQAQEVPIFGNQRY